MSNKIIDALNPVNWFKSSQPEVSQNKEKPKEVEDKSAIPPGRVSVPEDEGISKFYSRIPNITDPSFRTELIPLIRDLYKINPDVSIALQDMYKLANTSHTIEFPYNTDAEAKEMRKFLDERSKTWTNYTAGINGLVNKFIAQIMVGGAISIEAVPNKDLSGISTIVFINPETIRFRRLKDGTQHPYQINPNRFGTKRPEYIKLNLETYKYVSLVNDTDEAYGIPPFLGALDSIKGQHDMKINFKHIMELMGMVGFLEAKMEKPARKSNESEAAYVGRLTSTLRKLKTNLMGSLKDGIVTGYKDDHEFKLNSTTQNLQNIEKPWNMNQQSVANGLGVNGNLIGVQASSTEGGTGILLSKMISQLKNLQMMVAYVLEFIYTLELRLAGKPNKGIKVRFNTSTISDEVKVQQGLEYKIRNLTALYQQGIIGQDQFAWAMGYEKPNQAEPREDPTDDLDKAAAKQKREKDKDTSDRKVRDKNKTIPKRNDTDTRPR